MDYKRIFKTTDRSLTGIIGLAADIETFAAYLRYRINIYQLRENRTMEPRTLGWLIASSLYNRRFGPYFIEPLVAGLDKNNEPYLCTTDSIGCMCDGDNFFCIGTASELLLGACESFY